jgi:hypothetical protein
MLWCGVDAVSSLQSAFAVVLVSHRYALLPPPAMSTDEQMSGGQQHDGVKHDIAGYPSSA